MGATPNQKPAMASLLLRIGMGTAFLIWGIGHLFLTIDPDDRFGLLRVVGRLGLEPVDVWVKVLAGTEAVLGFFVLAGLFTRIAVWPLVALVVFTMIGGRWAHVLEYPHATIDQFVYLAALLGIFFCGPGLLSADRALARKKARRIENRD